MLHVVVISLLLTVVGSVLYLVGVVPIWIWMLALEVFVVASAVYLVSEHVVNAFHYWNLAKKVERDGNLTEARFCRGVARKELAYILIAPFAWAILLATIVVGLACCVFFEIQDHIRST